MRIRTPKKEKEIERAIMFLVYQVSKKCRNPKPVILHSIRTGLKLSRLNQPREVVVAGILHDVVEDTDCEIDLIRKSFGKKVADLVLALTQEEIRDYRKRWYVLVEKIKKAGKEAMIIKVVETTDNLKYLSLIKNPKTLEQTLWKYQVVRDSFKPYIGNLQIFKEFERKLKMSKKLRK